VKEGRKTKTRENIKWWKAKSYGREEKNKNIPISCSEKEKWGKTNRTENGPKEREER
jgi:hypothetical protein